ncbi:hypothetical protein ALC56_14404, partial [Trachymyrmex septentrionalis]
PLLPQPPPLPAHLRLSSLLQFSFSFCPKAFRSSPRTPPLRSNLHVQVIMINPTLC